jgi:hypothetical protein
MMVAVEQGLGDREYPLVVDDHGQAAEATPKPEASDAPAAS